MIFYHSEEQRLTAKQVIAEDAARLYDQPVVTAIEAADTFYRAEEHHQGYYDRIGSRNSYCTFVITPKVSKFRKQFADRLKPEAV